MRFGAPVCVGDTLEAETLILSVKPSSKNPNLGVVHVQTTGRNQDGDVVLTFQRKVQVWKKDPKAAVDDREVPPREIECTFGAPGLRREARLQGLAPSAARHVLRGLHRRRRLRARPRPRDHDRSHHADGRPRQHVAGALQPVDDRPGPERFVGGQLIVFGGIPFQLCLGLSSADVADNSPGDVRYVTGRHTAPSFAGDTLFAATEIARRAICRAGRTWGSSTPCFAAQVREEEGRRPWRRSRSSTSSARSR
jgi:acyl dehydratase